ncbi:aminoglycoside phosphotransferase family protein [Streptomyces sp. NBC_00259]|uniref:aminoglycoside phosphotransferase family protein n=1 Tax=Streptomyces sp. NBC_00259 TaxID=2903643 RepID=UPI002E2E2F4F|nr:aminoglycoside phosphotransferase family protein [Streptomyces sp. NBC_00259]
MDPVALYEEACAREGESGHYNRNVRMEADSGPVVVRMRSGDPEAMDLTLWSEADVLSAIGPHVPAAPRLLHASTDPGFQIHEFVEGRRVDALFPDGKPLPEPVLDSIETLFGRLLRVPARALPEVPGDWPHDGDTAGFAGRLLGLVRVIRRRHDATAGGLYEALGIPEDPCTLLQERAAGLAERPFRLLHADIHRKNMILGRRGQVVFLDWELALWGDPVYDLGDHLHKMSYSPAERHVVAEGWERAAPSECRTQWSRDLGYYLAYEAVKSAVVDTIRWGRRIAAEQDREARSTLAGELADKIAAARPHWTAGPRPAPEPSDIESAVEHWMA